MHTTFSPWVKTSRSGFSLVEVSIATGIAAMSIIMLFGLLPSGLNMFRESNNVATSTQIAQRLIYEAIQTDYDTLVNNATQPFSTRSGVPRYFDAEGVELILASDAIYHAYTRIAPSTSLPPSTASYNTSLATVTVQVVVNPNNQTIDPPIAQTNFLVEPPKTMGTQTYTGHIAKIK